MDRLGQRSNTTIFHSNYLLRVNEPFYEWSVKLWEGLEKELNYNLMASQRGIVNLIHSDAQRGAHVRRGNAMRRAGADAELLDREQLRAMKPYLDFDNARFPIKGALLRALSGTARHDAVVWGYARAADRLGVDIVQNCEVTGFLHDASGAVTDVETARGPIRAKNVAPAVAGSSSRLAARLDLRLNIESLVLQAFVLEAIKPLIAGVATFGAGHFYISQSDKGGPVFGGDLDGHNSHAQRGNLPAIEDVCEGGMAVMPLLGRLRLLRQWAGLCDMSMDGSPIIDIGPLPGLCLNTGSSYGGFKATPASGWCFAHTIAKDEPHPLTAAYRLDPALMHRHDASAIRTAAQSGRNLRTRTEVICPRRKLCTPANFFRQFPLDSDIDSAFYFPAKKILFAKRKQQGRGKCPTVIPRTAPMCRCAAIGALRRIALL